MFCHSDRHSVGDICVLLGGLVCACQMPLLGLGPREKGECLGLADGSKAQ